MDEQRAIALRRLVKKLSAVRQTLSNDEREILDLMVLGAAKPEVEGHLFKTAAKPAAKPEVEGHLFKTAAKPAAKPEVEGHVAKPAAKPAAKPEVEGHAFHAAATAAAKDAAKPEVEGHILLNEIRENIIFDPEKAAYVVAKARD